MKKCFKKGTIKVRKLILKERKGGLLDKKGVFSKDLFKKQALYYQLQKDQNNFWVLNMK